MKQFNDELHDMETQQACHFIIVQTNSCSLFIHCKILDVPSRVVSHFVVAVVWTWVMRIANSV